DNKLVYDVRTGSAMLAESAAWAQWVFFHLGGEDQLPDVFLTANVNPDTPAYRGSAYAVFLLQDLTDRRGSIPQYRFEVAGAASLTETPSPLVVYPWLQGVIDPRAPRNEHTYRYMGYTYQVGNPQNFPLPGGTLTSDLGVALGEA